MAGSSWGSVQRLQPLTRREWFGRWGILGLTATPGLRMFIPETVLPWGWIQCPLRHFTGIPCPSCGMTRAFLAMAQGNWQQAMEFHLLSPLVLILFVILAGHLMLEIQQRRRISTPLSRMARQWPVLFGSLGVLLLYHGWRLWQLQASGELAAAMAQAPLGHLW
ncbi:DUF2752 domain-containing protein [Lyngbya confervoides]|uniref:DUF2752 domain-containing protein n=1 Tax=Lyngbya confervoides BDU141951 TaxID=1574623 RepID=A0ABD4T5V1_9CYAN|nr:DUF2752 domain-containing protein [Lyngbya confervoides]MCM1983803.1 DUF2752 domain-containing protein [Lyngbya confervoides BDU141951]